MRASSSSRPPSPTRSSIDATGARSDALEPPQQLEVAAGRERREQRRRLDDRADLALDTGEVAWDLGPEHRGPARRSGARARGRSGSWWSCPSRSGRGSRTPRLREPRGPARRSRPSGPAGTACGARPARSPASGGTLVRGYGRVDGGPRAAPGAGRDPRWSGKAGGAAARRARGHAPPRRQSSSPSTAGSCVPHRTHRSGAPNSVLPNGELTADGRSTKRSKSSRSSTQPVPARARFHVSPAAQPADLDDGARVARLRDRGAGRRDVPRGQRSCSAAPRAKGGSPRERGKRAMGARARRVARRRAGRPRAGARVRPRDPLTQGSRDRRGRAARSRARRGDRVRGRSIAAGPASSAWVPAPRPDAGGRHGGAAHVGAVGRRPRRTPPLPPGRGGQHRQRARSYSGAGFVDDLPLPLPHATV